MVNREPRSDERHGAPSSVLITGGAGFIGSCVALQLEHIGARVVAVDDLSATPGPRDLQQPGVQGLERMDVTRPGALHEVLVRHGPFDCVLHLAAVVGVPRVLADPQTCFRRNIDGVQALIEAIAALPAMDRPRVLAASSSEVYADSAAPLDESSTLRAPCTDGRWAYATSKREGECLLDAAISLWREGQGPVHLRLFNVVGPGQSARSGMVMPTFVEQALSRRPLSVHGDGDQVRSFADVREVGDALVALLRHPRLPAGSLNVGGTVHASVLDLARRVACASRRIGGVEAKIEHVDPRHTVALDFVDVDRRTPGLSRLRKLGVELPSRALQRIVDDAVRRACGTAMRAAM